MDFKRNAETPERIGGFFRDRHIAVAAHDYRNLLHTVPPIKKGHTYPER